MSANQDIFTSGGPTNQQQHTTPESGEGARTTPSAIPQFLSDSESPAPPASFSGNSVDSESPPTPHFDEKNSAATFLHQKTIPTVWIESENSEDQQLFDKKTDQDQSCLQNTIPTVWIQPENSEENQELQRFDEKNNQVCLQNTIPTVWIQPENSENQQLCFDSEKTDLLRYTPTCVSDFNLAWVQFVMQQYYEANFDKKKCQTSHSSEVYIGYGRCKS